MTDAPYLHKQHHHNPQFKQETESAKEQREKKTLTIPLLEGARKKYPARTAHPI
jgi:hypothetical protein